MFKRFVYALFSLFLVWAPDFAHAVEVNCEQILNLTLEPGHVSRVKEIDAEILALKSEAERLEPHTSVLGPESAQLVRIVSKLENLNDLELTQFRRNEIPLKIRALEKEKWGYFADFILARVNFSPFPSEGVRKELINVQRIKEKPIPLALAWKVIAHRWLTRESLHLPLAARSRKGFLTKLQQTFALTEADMIEVRKGYGLEQVLLQQKIGQRLASEGYGPVYEWGRTKEWCCQHGCQDCQWNWPLRKLNDERP